MIIISEFEKDIPLSHLNPHLETAINFIVENFIGDIDTEVTYGIILRNYMDRKDGYNIN